jgi:hypothetical protein
MTKKKITAAELMSKLNADPEFVAKRAREEEERLKRVEALRVEIAPVLDDLRVAGCSISSASDLMKPPYPDAAPWPASIPVLLRHLQRDSYSADVRELVARALAVPETKAPGWNSLTKLYIDEPEDRVRSGLAAAIAAAADDEVIGDVIALARDRRQGSSRLLLLSALERSADPRARAALMDLGTDPDLTKEIQVILRRLGRSKR